MAFIRCKRLTKGMHTELKHFNSKAVFCLTKRKVKTNIKKLKTLKNLLNIKFVLPKALLKSDE